MSHYVYQLCQIAGQIHCVYLTWFKKNINTNVIHEEEKKNTHLDTDCTDRIESPASARNKIDFSKLDCQGQVNCLPGS